MKKWFWAVEYQRERIRTLYLGFFSVSWFEDWTRFRGGKLFSFALNID